MTVPEYLGWAQSLLDSLGLFNLIIAGGIIMIAIGAIKQFFGRG